MRNSFLQTIAQFLFPERCSGCGRFGVALCSTCTRSLTFARPLEKDTDFAVFDYGNKHVRQAIQEFKYRHHASRARILVRCAIPHITAFLSEMLHSTTPECLILVPVPQHISKTHSRGYNQSLLIAKWITASLPDAIVQEVLFKSLPSVPQVKTKNKQARKQNVAHTMRTTISLDPKAIYIVVDDVTTTGATLNEASRALRQGGGKKILSVSIAHGYIS